MDIDGKEIDAAIDLEGFQGAAADPSVDLVFGELEEVGDLVQGIEGARVRASSSRT